MIRWWKCVHGKFFEEYVALLRTVTNAGVDVIKNSVGFLKSPGCQ
jgi:hypothetical protein